ncbi:hypothetical protein GCM10009527_095570 [Actinomadura nitritigenes]
MVGGAVDLLVGGVAEPDLGVGGVVGAAAVFVHVAGHVRSGGEDVAGAVLRCPADENVVPVRPAFEPVDDGTALQNLDGVQDGGGLGDLVGGDRGHCGS